MKRRNVDSGKPRRTLKRTNKFAEGVYGSSFIYLKFVLVWCLILLADFVLEFRFEYLWPFWLLVRSVCDSFKYQGLGCTDAPWRVQVPQGENHHHHKHALSVFFVGIAITSDMICLLFIPIQWLFFMASTYVWVQYIWHTDRGICLPTVSLWLLFMYIEATVRLKDLKNSPFHVDLCRPFAAHCIGYPVVTLGFGFKSYVQYRLRLRTQREVQKENEFYRELLSGALPPELRTHALPSTEKNSIKGSNSGENGMISNGTISHTAQSHSINNNSSSKREKNQSTQHRLSLQDSNSANRNAQPSSNDSSPTCRSPPPPKAPNNSCNNATSSGNQNQTLSTSRKVPNQQTNNLSSSNSADKEKQQTISATTVGMSFSEIQQSSGTEIRRRINSSSNTHHSPASSTSSSISSLSSSTSKKSSNGINIVPTARENTDQANKNSSSRSSSTSNGSNSPKSNKYTSSNGHMVTILNDNKQSKPSKETVSLNEDKSTIKSKRNEALRIQELENCVSKLRFELYSTQQCEGDLRLKNYALLNDEKSAKNELAHLRRDNDQLQTKLHNLVNVKQKDKLALTTMEKKLRAEMEAREVAERILLVERKKRKEDDETAAKAVALATSNREKENAEENKRNFKQLEKDYENLRNQFREKEEVCKSLEKEIASLLQKEKVAKETDTLMSALAAMQEKNLMLEKSLSAETRLKLDLFSALGDAKRQLEIATGMMFKKDSEIRELKSRVADVLAVLPESQIRSSTPHYSSTFLEKQQAQPHVPLSPTQHYSAAFCSVPVQTSPLSAIASGMEAHPAMIHMMTHSPGMVRMPLDPNAANYTPASSGN